MKFVRRSLVVAVSLPVLLAGCGGDPIKPAPLTLTPTPTSSSPTATATKAAWEQKTPAGAEAFAKHWIDVFNKAGATGDTKAFKALGKPGCVSCNSLAGYLDDLYASGGSMESRGWKVLRANSSELHDGSVTVSILVARASQIVHHKPPKKEEHYPASRASYSLNLLWTAGKWLVSRMVTVK